MSEHLQLVDYRHRVEEIYARVRTGAPTEETWLAWRADRDQLFASNPQSPIQDQESFKSLPYFDFNPSWRVLARFEEASETSHDVGHSGYGSTNFERIGSLRFEAGGKELSLDALWLNAYGGGLFVPFRDRTNGVTTYGGGRYLLDTVKGADLGMSGSDLVLDFNYAYHPSCVHSPRWSCPLAPPDNSLDIPIEAGERLSPA